MLVIVLYVITMHTEDVIYSDFLDPQSNLSVLQSQACTHTNQESLETIAFDHRYYRLYVAYDLTFNPRTSAQITTILGFAE